MFRVSPIALVLAAAALSGGVTAARAQRPPLQSRTVEVAFLEDCNGDEQTADSARVRLAFRSLSGGWAPVGAQPADTLELRRAARQLSASRTWEALRGGQVVGTIHSEGVPTYDWYADFGVQRLVGPLPSFASGPRSDRFAGWSDAPRRQPIVLVSAAPHGDPEGWRSARPIDVADAEMVRAIRSAVTDLAPCGEDSSEDASVDSLHFAPRDLRAAAAYASRNGDRLVAFVIRTGADVCNGFGGTGVGPFWFFIRNHGSRRFIADGLALIDHADLDGDGHTEFLFWRSGYNLDGYRVYWDGFTKSAEFAWNYH